VTLKYKAILFDVDGTMVDNMPVHAQTWITFFGSLGLEVNEESIHTTMAGRTSADVIKFFLPGITDEQVNQHEMEKEALYKQIYQPVMRETPGLTHFLEQARAMGIKMAVASVGGIDIVGFVLNNLKITHFFDAVVSAEDVKNGKPDPEIFLLAASRLGIAPGDCLVIEDTLAGLLGAQRAGMRSIAITTGFPAEMLNGYASVIKVIDDFDNLDPGSLAE